MLKTRGFQLITTIFFMALPCSLSRKYDIEAECYKLYHEDLYSVLQRFRRTPEYSRILEDQFNQFRTTTFNIMKVKTFQYFTSKMAAKISEMFGNQSSPTDTSQQEEHKLPENDEKQPGTDENDTKVPGPQESAEKVPGTDENVPGSQENGEKVPGSQENGEKVPGSQENEEEVAGSQENAENVPEAEENYTKEPEILNSEVENDVKEPILNTVGRENGGKKMAVRENADSFAFQDTLLYTKRNPVGRLDSYHKLGSALKLSERNSMKDLGFQYAGYYIDELIKHVRNNLKDIEIESRHDTTDAYYMRQGDKYININLSKTNQNDKVTKEYVKITKKADKDTNKNDATTTNKDDKAMKNKVNTITKKTNKTTKKNITTTRKDRKTTNKDHKNTKKDLKRTKKEDKSTKKDVNATNANNNTSKKNYKSTKKDGIITKNNNSKKKNETTAKTVTMPTRNPKVNLFRLVTAVE